MASLDRLAAIYQDVLQNRLGIDCRRCTPDTIAFTRGELAFIACLYSNDPEYLRLLFRGSMPEELDAEQRHSICARITRDVKTVKITTEGTDLVAAIEMFVAGQDLLPEANHLAAVLPRAIRTLEAALTRLGEVVRLEVALNQEP